MKTQEKQIKIVESILKEVYTKYENKGVLSIYLWGSILTKDFNPKLSDIDSIAIVNKNAKIKDNGSINNFLKVNSSCKDFKLNYLYLDELNGGKIKSRLAKAINPKLLLLDFKNWKCVNGKKYSRKDFKLKEIDFDEAIKIELEVIKKRFLPLFKKNEFQFTQYFTKYLIMICYYLNQKESGKHKFTYYELLKRSPENRKKIIRVLLQLKKNKWDEKLMKKHLDILTNFFNTLD